MSRHTRNFQAESGSIIVYLIMAIVLTGALIAYMTQGTSKDPLAQQLDETMQYLDIDIKTIESSINDCVLAYPNAVDINNDGTKNATDNPNAPFPLYGDLSSGGSGTALSAIKCPGAPAAQQVIFNNNPGRNLRLLSSADYTVTYLSDGTEGIKISVVRASTSDVWLEAISRMNTKLAACRAEISTSGGCANGCFYLWIKRRSTSVATEGGCP